ncbi:MAG: hypothetical protein MIO92_08545 [Methanosarcinaceae archaeon]|nr:hypothetical protein [Methanosarcinaceae archaeon]
MGDEWQIDLKIPDIGSMITLFAVSVCSAILSSAEIAYTMMWITSAYERHGKDFFIDLINAKALTWTAEFVLVAGSLLLMSSLVFLMTMIVSLVELNGLGKEDKKAHLRIISVLFSIGLLLLVLALVSAILLRYL